MINSLLRQQRDEFEILYPKRKTKKLIYIANISSFIHCFDLYPFIVYVFSSCLEYLVLLLFHYID